MPRKRNGGAGRTLAWTIFDEVANAGYAGQTIGFQYDADHNRVMQIASGGQTVYLPDGEVFTPTGGAPVWHTYCMADGERVAEAWGPTGQLAHHYFQSDYQNSIGLVTDDSYSFASHSGTDQNLGYDTFGQPRNPNGTADPLWGANAVTKRGYINQEQLTGVRLIDLNARVYDPYLAKFLSPDPVIAEMGDSQAWNAYAYSRNNPMSKEDPTGLCPDDQECLTVTPPPKLTSNILPGAESATASHYSSGGGHASNMLAGLAARAVQGRPNSPAQRSLGAAGYGAVAVASDAPGGVAAALAATIESGVSSLIGATKELTAGAIEMDGGGGLLKLEAEAAEGATLVAKSAYQLGVEGETAVKNAFDIGDKVAINIGGRTIIPDGLNATTLSEVKNVGSLSFTNQLRTYSDFAQQNGLGFNLYTRSDTTLSGPLQSAIDSGLINRLDIPQ